MRVITLDRCTASPALSHPGSRNYSPASFHADPEQTAEDYVMERLRPGEEAVFQQHLIQCRACTKTVAETREFVVAIRDAGRVLRWPDQPK